MKLLTLSFLALVGFGAAGDRPLPLHAARTAAVTADVPRPAARGPRVIPAASYAPEDAADSLWRAGRIAIADENWREAARLFERLVTDHPRSAYAGDALYWQAFALQRVGNSADLRRAARALETQRDRYATSATWTSGEGPALLARVNGRLARTAGDADAAAAVAEVAAGAAAMAADIAAAVAPAAAAAAAAEIERADPAMREAMREEMRADISRSIAAAQRENAGLERERAAMERERAAMARGSARMGRGRSDDEVPAECEDVVSDERIEALNALMQMNSEQALPVLRRVMARRDRCSEYLRRKAVFIVSQRRNDEAAQMLVDAAKNDPDRGVRSEAIFWLSQTNSDVAVDVLEQVLLKDAPDEDLQKRAIYALSQTRSPRAGAILRDYVRREDAPEDLRADAIFWLGQSGRGTDNTPFLREIFPTLNSDELREKVLFSVSQRRSPENSQWLLARARDRELSTELRKTALFWASQGGAVTAEQLGEIYRTSGEDTELRGQVIFALSQRRNDTGAVDLLLEIARKETDRDLRRQALFWLGQSRDPRAAAALEEIINKP